MPFAATWLDAEILTPNEVSQTQILYDIAFMQNLKTMIQMNLHTKQKQTHKHRKQISDYKRGKGGRDTLGVWV